MLERGQTAQYMETRQHNVFGKNCQKTLQYRKILHIHQFKFKLEKFMKGLLPEDLLPHYPV